MGGGRARQRPWWHERIGVSGPTTNKGHGTPLVPSPSLQNARWPDSHLGSTEQSPLLIWAPPLSALPHVSRAVPGGSREASSTLSPLARDQPLCHCPPCPPHLAVQASGHRHNVPGLAVDGEHVLGRALGRLRHNAVPHHPVGRGAVVRVVGRDRHHVGAWEAGSRSGGARAGLTSQLQSAPPEAPPVPRACLLDLRVWTCRPLPAYPPNP